MGGRVVVAVVVLALLVGGAVAVVAATGGSLPRALPGGPACRVTVGASTVDLTTEQAERVSAGQDGFLSPAESDVVATALSGRAPEALTCDHGPGLFDADEEPVGREGLTPRARVVRRELDAAFGRQRVGGFAPGGVSTGHIEGSAHYEGRAVDVFYRPVTTRAQRRGWATAQWLVANAERLSVRTVIYDDRIWTARRSGEGWRDYRLDTTGLSAATTAVLEHRDHVHLDVS